MKTVRLDIGVVLPGIEDEQDACLRRLVAILRSRPGIGEVHVTHGGEDTAHEAGLHPEGQAGAGAEICLHYDPERLSLPRLRELAASAGATITDRYQHVVLPIRSVGSEDQGIRLEQLLQSLPGVTAAAVSIPAQSARVEFERERTGVEAIRAALKEAEAAPVSEEPGTGFRSRYARNRELIWSLAAGAFTLAGWLVDKRADSHWIGTALLATAYGFGARDNVGNLLQDIRRGRFHFNIDLLMIVAAIGAAALGQWAEGALLLFLFSLGHALEHYAMGRARNAITALADLAPQTALLRRPDGRDEVVPVNQVRQGDLAVVKPGERIAVDGTVREGRSAVNQAPITGESVPVEKTPSEKVFAGSVNGDGVLIVEVTAAVGDRTLDRVIKLVSEAETQKAPTQLFTDRFERIFVPLVLVADVVLIVVPALLGALSWEESFYRGMALLVAASPCALALGTPAAVLAGIAQAARNGVLIKGGASLEVMGSIRVLALDKTGTITRGEPEVTEIVPAAGATESDLLGVAAAVESQSQHPLARAIVREAERRGASGPRATDVQAITGQGIRGLIQGVPVEIGRLALFENRSLNIPGEVRAAVTRLEAAGNSTMVVRQDRGDGGWLGTIGVADQPRAGVRETLNGLRAAGIRRIVMLTGDNAGVGNAVGAAVGVDEVRAQLMPEDKVSAIKELANQGKVAMVGDGVNDAPALAHATVGIAMGGAGTAAALETADIALMGDELERLVFAVHLSRQARGIIRQNLVVSLAVIAALSVTTVAGVAGIGAAVIAHEGSTLVVIANALRLLAFRGDRAPVRGVATPARPREES